MPLQTLVSSSPRRGRLAIKRLSMSFAELALHLIDGEHRLFREPGEHALNANDGNPGEVTFTSHEQWIH